MAYRAALLTAGFLLCGSRVVYAAAPSSGPLALDVEGQAGWVQGAQSGGVALGGSARVRYGVLTGGGSLQGATTLFATMGSLSALGGLSLPVGLMRFDALGELGINAYSGVGGNFLRHDPGAHATLPFVGVRAQVLAYVFRNARGGSIWLGPSVQYAQDLSATLRTYSYRDQGTDWFSGENYDRQVTSTVRVGQSRISILVTVGATIPW
jgi:hypothetical protein